MIQSQLVVTKQTPLASRGLVVAEHPLGARVGAAILEEGGNAVDAAVATAFAMTVVEPFMSTLAGSGTMLVHLATRGETVAIDFNGQAPARADATMFRLIGGVSEGLFAWPRVENAANEYGHRSVAVPGSVAGLALALERYGTMGLADVLTPAIALARDGFVPDWYQALTTARYIEELGAFPEAARVYLRNGRAIHRPPSLEPGERVAYPDLARSLALIAREGPDAFYRGALAQAIHDEMAAGDGLLTKGDLAAYEVRVSPPLTGRYRGLDLALAPGATGGITALEILNILDHFAPHDVGWQTTAGLHFRAEAIRRAFRDRFLHLGDSAIVKAPWDQLASKPYAQAIAADLRRPGRTGAGTRPRRARRVHDAHRRRRQGTQHGLADSHGRVALRFAGGRQGHRDPAQQRHDLVRPLARQAELDRARQARARQHGASARLPEGRAVPHARRARRSSDRLGDPTGDRDPRGRARLAPGGDRGSAPAHRRGRAARGRARRRQGARGAPTVRAHGRSARGDLRDAELREARRDPGREEGARGGTRPPAAGGGRRVLALTPQEGKTMATLEDKVIASWKYKKGALDPKTAYLCYLAANLAVGNTH